MVTRSQLEDGYEAVKAASLRAANSSETAGAVRELAAASLRYLLEECDVIELTSRVEGKEYEAFVSGGVNSRPFNTALFLAESDVFAEMWDSWQAGELGADDRNMLFYTAGLAPGLAMELFNRQNRKGPATFFEHFVGHLASSLVGANPRRSEILIVRDHSISMTMDYIFHPQDRARVHLAVKMSTRERVVQAWAHQRLLRESFPDEVYRGVLVVCAETKLDSRTHEVVEICVPDQWLAYQSLLARMDAVYYFDIPNRYRALADEYPDLITIMPIGEFRL